VTAVSTAAERAALEELIVACHLTPKNAQSARIILALCGWERAEAFVRRNSNH